MNDYIHYNIHKNIFLPIHTISEIRYGINNNNIDITDIALNKCVRDNNLIIPSNDHKRAAIFGDPVVNKVKKIYIKMQNTNIIFNTNVNIKNVNSLLLPYNIDENIENIVNDSDIVVLQENYKYMFWTTLAVGTVLLTMNIV